MALPGANDVQTHFGISVVGGLIGVSAPMWRTSLRGVEIIALVELIAAAIAFAGWLMGQPLRAKDTGEHGGLAKETGGTLLGSLAGAGVGMALRIDHVLKSLVKQLNEPIAFILAFTVAGGVAWLSTYQRNTEQGSPFATAGTTIGIAALSASAGFFQSTFLTTAFVTGKGTGGHRGALGATTLEGAVGFSAFIVGRIVGWW